MLQPSPLFSQSWLHTRPCQGGQDFSLGRAKPQAVPALALCHKLGSIPRSEMALGGSWGKGLVHDGDGVSPCPDSGARDAASPCKEKKKLTWGITFQLNREMSVKHLCYYLYYLEDRKKRIFFYYSLVSKLKCSHLRIPGASWPHFPDICAVSFAP